MRFSFDYRSLLVAVSAAASISCASASESQLRTRAASDLGCSSIKVIKVDSLTRRVEGCDKSATYVETCDGRRDEITTSCTWALNSHEHSLESRPPTAPTGGTCMPNDTKACLGPGACQGAQACREDGKSFTPCDCGTAPGAAPDAPKATTSPAAGGATPAQEPAAAGESPAPADVHSGRSSR